MTSLHIKNVYNIFIFVQVLNTKCYHKYHRIIKCELALKLSLHPVPLCMLIFHDAQRSHESTSPSLVYS